MHATFCNMGTKTKFYHRDTDLEGTARISANDIPGETERPTKPTTMEILTHVPNYTQRFVL